MRTASRRRSVRFALAANSLTLTFAVSFGAAALRSDEGMWLYNAFPVEAVRSAYGFAPDQVWLKHLQLASLRVGGSSGSFVSPDGLAVTNHHVIRGCISNLSSKEHDYMNDGFVAATRAEEKTCPGLEISRLLGIERVTARVRGVERGADSPAAAEAARKREMAAIEKECSDAGGDQAVRCDVVTLYSGQEFDLYRYRRYTDARLAFAPATQMAQFGGDADNFEFPRHSTDFALLRLYENGKPVASPGYLKFAREGVADGDFVAVSGHPGSTGRLLTVAQREFLRDVQYPIQLLRLNTRRDSLVRFGERGAEEKRIARDDLRSVENGIKATSGYLSGLLDEGLVSGKATEERELRAAVSADAALAQRTGDPWSEIETALAGRAALYPRLSALDGVASAGALPGHARTLIRLARERAKPSGERLREYRDTALPQIHHRLAAEEPIYPPYEEATLASALRVARTQLGPLHPVIREALGRRTPEEVARTAVAGTRLGTPAHRLELEKADATALEASSDPMIRLLLALEPLAIALRRESDDRIDAVEKAASTRISEAYFAWRGTSVYPDATGTLRLSFGRVAGVREGGRDIAAFTRMGGYFELADEQTGAGFYDLPGPLAAARDRVDGSTPLDFAATLDIIGGNSGSPVVDRRGDFVGVVFDGNLWGLPNRFAYDDERSRAITVDARAILEVLRRVYPAGHLADEIVAARR